ncbi:MAG: DUF192 domain-containing protein [Candidatus Aenigmarchaeota archaeon]|nr:DUF192 domain-containing protein [Candidatus Aenigmarchaeota archaeon]
MERKFIFALAFVLVLLFLLPKPLKEKTIHFHPGGNNVALSVKIADTGEARAGGLMFVKSLGEAEGMLFVFPDEAKREFWMKNTPVPLDMIFVSSNGTAVGVVENAMPCEKDPCQTYSVNSPSKFVVETNAGFAKENGIGIGTPLSDLYQTGW